MMVIAALLTSLCIAREWERGTMEQLIATPVKTPELILGKMAPYFLIGFIDMGLSVTMAVLLFGVPFKGSLFLLTVISAVFLFGGLSFASSSPLSPSPSLSRARSPWSQRTFPHSSCRVHVLHLQHGKTAPVLTHIVPARYFVAILKGLFLKEARFGL